MGGGGRTVVVRRRHDIPYRSHIPTLPDKSTYTDSEASPSLVVLWHVRNPRRSFLPTQKGVSGGRVLFHVRGQGHRPPSLCVCNNVSTVVRDGGGFHYPSPYPVGCRGPERLGVLTLTTGSVFWVEDRTV